MSRDIIAAIVLVFVSFRNGGAEDIAGDVHTESANYVRPVNLGILFVYDDFFDVMRKKAVVSIPADEYFSLMAKMAEKTHFANVTCTNISLVSVGSRKLDESAKVEVKAKNGLDGKATLDNFRNYSLKHRKEFGKPDVTVLVTADTLEHNSDFCDGMPGRLDITTEKGRLQSTHCEVTTGASYFKGMCGENSVAVIRDDGRNWLGVTELARQIGKMMGVRSDVLRNESECYNLYDHVTSSGWFNAWKLRHPSLSSCAQKELINYIDSMSNSSDKCWEDVPNATITSLKLTPDNLLEKEDLCAWTSSRNGMKCRIQTTSDDPSTNCSMPCCKKDGNPSSYSVFPPGKTCGQDGVCFNTKCVQ